MPITATRTTTFAPGGDQDGDTFVDFGDVLRHTLVINNTVTNATGVVVNDPLNGSTLTGSVNVSPLAFDDIYNAVGNTLLEVGNATAQTGPQSSYVLVSNVTANDVEFFSDTFTISAFNATSVNLGTVTMVTSGADMGSFTYISAAGYEGTDSFTYTIRDKGLDGIAGNADDLTSTATVTITVGGAQGQVWYVDQSYAGANGSSIGTSLRPFTSLTELNGVNDDGSIIDDVDGANDFIHVRGAATGAGLVLESGQQLIGTGVNLVVNAQTLLSASSNSSISDASGFTLQLDSGNTVSGLNVLSTAAALGTSGAITGTNFGTLTVSSVAIDGGNSQALILNNGTIAGGGFTSTDSDGGTNNVSLTSVAGNLNLGGGALSGATGVAFLINGGANGVDYNGTVTHTGNAIAVQVLNKTGGTVDFDGAVTSNTASDGVSLTSNTGATINFDGGLVINTSASNSAGFTATGGGTISVTDAGAGMSTTISSGTGTALNLSGVTVGNGASGSSNGITFDSVSNSGAANGILLASIGQGAGSTGIDINGGTIAGATSRGVDIDLTQADVSIAATISDTATGRTVEVTNSGRNVAGGSIINFSGAIDENGLGINLDNNDQNTNGAVISFTGGLDIDSAAGGTGFNAINGGTVNVTGSTNSIVASGAAALNVAGTTIGASDLNFRDISANGGTNGIVLNGTGSSGGLIVTGTGSAGSGGTIQNQTGDGIVLTDTQDFVVARMNISGPDGHGINASNLRGISSITDSAISGWDTTTATKDGIHLVNNNVNMTGLTITRVTFTGSNTSGSNDGVFMEGQGTASMALKIDDSDFTRIFGDGVQVNGITGGTGTVQVTVQASTFTNSDDIDGADVNGGTGGISLNPFGAINFFADINGNVFNDIVRPVVNVGAIGITSGGTANADITIRNNDLDDINGGRGITATIDGGHTELMISGNSIDNLGSTSKYAISVNSTNNAGIGTVGNVDVTIQNNLIGQVGNLWSTGNGSAEAVFVTAQAGASMDALITGNTIDANATLEVIRGRAIGGGTVMNLTMTNNDVADTFSTHIGELAAVVGNSATGPATLNTSITGNTVVAGGTILLTESATGPGTLNVTQASSGAVATANNNPAVSVSGTPQYGSPAPTLPTNPTLPSAPLFVAEAPPSDGGTGDTGGDPGTPGATTGDLAPSGTPDAGPVVVDDGVLSQAELDLIVGAAIDRWAAAGASVEQLAAMRATVVSVDNLAGLNIGLSNTGTIVVDDNAAGFSWFVDTTPGDDSEYTGSGTQLSAPAHTLAGDRVDLLTTIMHELGHQIGLDDIYAPDGQAELMYGTVFIGERRLPGADDAGAGDGAASTGSPLALTPINIGSIPLGESITIQWDSTLDTFGAGFAPSYSNFSTITGTNPGAFSVNSNTEVLSTTSTLKLDSLTLGGTVWNDNGAGVGGVAGDGIRNSVSEPGVSGVSVTLFIDNGSAPNVWDATDTLVAGSTQSTNGSGDYSFVGLGPGSYIVRVDLANFTGGALNALQASSTTVPEPIDPDVSDPDVDNDDNGSRAAGQPGYSSAITLAFNTEPTAGPGNDTNTTLDFAFRAVHLEPTLTATGLNPNYTEDAAAVDLFGGVVASTVDAGQTFTSLTLTVSNVTDGAAEILSFDGSDVALTNGNAVTTATNGLSVSVVLAGSLATVTFSSATLSNAALGTLVDGLTYRNSSQAPTDANRVVTITQLVDSGNGTAPDDNTLAPVALTSTVNVDPVADAPVAQPDAVTTPENVVGTGSVFANNGSGADVDVDGPPLSVSAVVGGTVGTQFSLPSNAKLTLLSDGTYSYDPNGKFNYLISSATAAATNAVNTTATDTFDYTLTGGNTVTVTMTVTGVDGAGDQLWGDLTDNDLVGTPGNDRFNLSQGGEDTVQAGAGSDIIYYGGALTGTDENDGGPEDRDAVVLQGNYTITLGALSLVNIEYLSLQSGTVTKFGQDGTNSYDYNITMAEENAPPSPPGQRLVINGQSLQIGEDLTIDASAETDGGKYLIYAGFGTDTLTGGDGSDIFHFEGTRFGAADTVDGGLGMDAVVISKGTGINHINFGETQFTGIESISVNNRFATSPLETPSYELVLRNGNVTAGGNLIVNGSSLVAPQTIDVDGSLVTGGTLTLYGGEGDDAFIGGALGDLIYAAGGADQSTGGLGLGGDTFQYRDVADSTSGAEDTILDFEVGIDQIDLSFIDAQSGGGDEAFGFIDATAFSGAAGELRAELIGGVWNVEGDVNGDGIGDFLILVTATTADPITGADFVL